MLNCEGNLVHSADHKSPITPLDPDPYNKYPSVDVINETINQIIYLGIYNLEIPECSHWPENRLITNYESHNMTNQLLENALIGRIGSALGGSPSKFEKLLFTKMLDHTEYQFESDMSALKSTESVGLTS